MESTSTESKPVDYDSTSKKERRKYRFKNSTIAKREIKKYQTTTKNLMPKRSFSMLVREIASDYKSEVRFSGDSMSALQEASEEYITSTMRRAMRNAKYATRATIRPSDMYAIDDNDDASVKVSAVFL